MKRLISLTCIALTLVASVLTLQANTVKWIVLPQYDKIDQYGDIYVVQHDNITQLMDITGKIINNSQCQSITPWLSNGFSLLLDNIGNQEATLVGIYNCKLHIVIPTKDGQYKVRTDYAFFSDDRLPVKDTKKGKWGYVDIDGNIAIACQYDNAYPFSDKCAPVRTSDKIYKYINSNGDLAFRVTVDQGKIKSATPFFSNRTAYVLYKGGREIAKINRKGEKTGEKISNSDGQYWSKLLADWLLDYNKNHENEPSEPGLKPLDIDLVEKDQSEVFKASNGQAIIRAQDGKMGILRQLDDDFTLGKPTKIKNKKQHLVTMRLDIPGGLSSDDVTFEINKGDGHLQEADTTDYNISNDKQTVTFKFSRNGKASSKNITLGIVVKHHGLIIFSKNDIKPDDDPEPPIPVEKCTYCGQKKHDWKHPICPDCGYMTGNVLANYRCEANGHHNNRCKDRRCNKLIIKKFKPKYNNKRCPVNGGSHGKPK